MREQSWWTEKGSAGMEAAVSTVGVNLHCYRNVMDGAAIWRGERLVPVCEREL